MQRIFDVDNKEDMDLLWSILPDDIVKLSSTSIKEACYGWFADCGNTSISLIKINWHDKTEITRPMPEVTKKDIGKLCYFWDNNTSNGTYCILVEAKSGMYKSKRKGYYEHARRLTKQEIEELC